MTAAPTRVVLYSYASGAARAAAEFRRTPSAGVSLTVIDPEWGSLAERYYQRGVPYDAERRLVLPNESEAFMRALVQPKDSTYSRFVDESDETAAHEEQ